MRIVLNTTLQDIGDGDRYEGDRYVSETKHVPMFLIKQDNDDRLPCFCFIENNLLHTVYLV